MQVHQAGRWAGALCLFWAFAASAASPFKVNEHITLFPGTYAAEGKPDGNALLITAPEGLIIVDAGRHPAFTQALIDEAQRRQPAQVLLVNSHWHLDHSGGIAALRAAFPGTQLFANDPAIRNIGSGLLADYRKQLVGQLKDPNEAAPGEENLRAEIALIDGSVAAYPDINLTRSSDLTLLGRTMHFGVATGVSGGDVWLRDDEARVLVAGGLVTLPAPKFETACGEVWSGDLNVLAAQRFDQLVPGHGRVMSRQEFNDWQSAFDDLLKCSATSRPTATCRNAWLKSMRRLVDQKDQDLATRLLDHGIDNILRNSEAQQRLCAGR